MKRILGPRLLVFGLLVFLSGCGAAYTGLSGNTMYNNGLADTAITPISGLEAVAAESYFGTMPSNGTLDPSIRVRYAIFGDTGGQSVKRHAHIIFAELTDKNRWEMAAETFAASNEMSLNGVKIDRRPWTEHIFFERREGDWFTEFWDINGYLTPKAWLGKRWSRSYDMSSRIVVEYREPMPDCVRIPDPKKAAIIFSGTKLDIESPECRREVEAVLERADQAFSMRRPANVNVSAPAPAEALSVKPERKMDLKRYVGEAVYTDPTIGGNADD